MKGEFINVNNSVAVIAEAVANRAATVDEALSTKLEKDAVDEVKAKSVKLDQTIAAHAKTVKVQLEVVNSAVAEMQTQLRTGATVHDLAGVMQHQ